MTKTFLVKIFLVIYGIYICIDINLLKGVAYDLLQSRKIEKWYLLRLTGRKAFVSNWLESINWSESIPPRDIKILGQRPAGPFLPHGEKVLLQPWLVILLVMVSQEKCVMGQMFCIDQLRTPSFPTGLFKTECGFIVRSVETGLGR